MWQSGVVILMKQPEPTPAATPADDDGEWAYLMELARRDQLSGLVEVVKHGSMLRRLTASVEYRA